MSEPEDGPVQLPGYLSLNSELGVVICVEHGSSYVGATVKRHLSEAHSVKPGARRSILDFLASAGLVQSREDVSRPEDGIVPVHGLPMYNGFACLASSPSSPAVLGARPRCRYFSTRKSVFDTHCRTSHGISTGARGGRPKAGTTTVAKDAPVHYGEVMLQTLWAEKKHIDYFTVEVTASQEEQQQQQQQQEEEGDEGEEETTTALWRKRQRGNDRGGRERLPQAASDEIMARYNQVQQMRLDQYDKVLQPTHTSDLTAWLRSTGYQAHLEGVEVDELLPSYSLPKAAEDPQLAAICRSVKRVLRVSMDIMDYDNPEDRQLSRLNAKLLNTFTAGEMSQDPFKPLQNERSKGTYTLTWQKLCCYFSRVTRGDFLQHKILFKPTALQSAAWEVVLGHADAEIEAADAASATRPRRSASPEGGVGRRQRSRESTSAERETAGKLDRSVLAFSLALIQQRLGGRSFDSPVVSFVAVLAWDTKQNTWMKVGDHTSHLSQLIYDCQLITLQHVLDTVEEGGADDTTEYLVGYRNKWLLNETPGPFGELLSTRLLGLQISRSTVNQAQVRWHADGETIVYGSTQLKMQDIRDLIRHELAAAQAVLEKDLCFELPDTPQYPVGKLVDNWDRAAPGESFVTDTRNESLLKGGDGWLVRHVSTEADLAALLFHKTADGGWRPRSSVARQYEHAVQRFLGHMMVLMHVGSGQPARRPELQGLRWCNKQADKRNLFVHDGHVLFILTYHKSLSVTNGSRYPVRVLLPKVGELLVRFLTVVQPFRAWLLAEAGICKHVGENLWTEDGEVWPEDKITRVFASRSRAAIGITLNVRSWRQIGAGIVIKKFAGDRFPLDVSATGTEDIEDGVYGSEDGPIPEAFHWQSAHTPSVGNRAYGGTINFRQGLTDAGLQEFIRISKLWHRFITTAPSPGLKHARQQSATAGVSEAPLAKRLAFREPKARCRTRWSMEEARVALEGMYGPGARYRSKKQEEAIRAVVMGYPEVLIVLGTGEGKSLVYTLAQRLQGVGTTVLIVPLVALKQDTIRRCEQLGVDCSLWTYAAEPIGIGNSLVLVSLDVAVGTAFQSYLHRLDASGYLSGVVFDECHLVITASGYREKMGLVKQLRSLRCQFVFLTATLPPCLLPAFQDAVLARQAYVVRSISIRRDIEYYVKRYSSQEFIGSIVGGIKSALASAPFTGEESARALVYTRTRAEADEVARLLACPVYYSDSGSTEEKAGVLMSWAQGGTKVLVATSAFGAGVDYSAVRYVFHVGAPKSAVDFTQEMGRGGRDGQGCVSCVYLPHSWRPAYKATAGELLPQEVISMQRYLDSPRCRRLPLGEFLDGVGASCTYEDAPCDRCEELGLLGEVSEREEEYGRGEGAGAEMEGWDQGGVALKEHEQGQERMEGWDQGGVALKEHEQGQERMAEVFVRQLELVAGKCIVCILDGSQRSGGQGVHPFKECRRQERFDFFAAKKQAVREGKQLRGGWLAGYSACYRCGNTQEVCGRQGQAGCRYEDIVLPAAWFAFRWAESRAKLVELTGRDFESEGEYMLWLGEKESGGSAAANASYSSNLIQVVSKILNIVAKRVIESK